MIRDEVLQLSLGVSSNPRTHPIIDGRVKPQSIRFRPTVMHPSEMFWRQLKFAEFDVCEMSLSSLMISQQRGDDRFVAIPVFTTRSFYHTSIVVRRDAGIETPADLKGKRVGVPEYQQTAAVWTRGILEEHFGVAPRDMTFFMERGAERSHGSATGFTPPDGVSVTPIPADTDLGSMIVAGEIDAIIYYLRDKNLVDRSKIDLAGHPDVTTLFPDPLAESARYYRKTGFLPVNHTTVIRRDVFEANPWIALNIVDAFRRAAAMADAQRVQHAEYHIATGLLPPGARDALARPLIEHNLPAMRPVLKKLAEYVHRQGLVEALPDIDALFADSTRE